MIIECERCRSKFNLEDSLLKEEGSKVRCSVCRHVFVAYPPEPAFSLEAPPEKETPGELGETVALDSPPDLEDFGPSMEKDTLLTDVDTLFKEATAKEAGAEEAFQAMSLDDLTLEEGKEEKKVEEEEEGHDLAEAMGLAEEIESTLTTKDKEKKAGKKEEAVIPPKHIPIKKGHGLMRALVILLVFLALVMGGGAAAFLWAPDLLPDPVSFLKSMKKEEAPDPGTRQLRFSGVEGSFVQSNRGGELFVIQGNVINKYGKPRSFVLLRASILGEKGKVMKTKLAYAGNPLKEDEVKALSLEEIEKAGKNRAGKGGMNLKIKPDGSIPFTVVVEDLARDASEFTVEAVSSSEGE